MKYVVAVSGGVDSVVLLDKLVKSGEHELVVAHFDHGIRKDSAADARFVEALARRYGLPYEQKREELGAGASEDDARSRRYAFLFDVAKRHDATVVTAHHADDVIETIAINLSRGSGWRGLAVLGNPSVVRPLTTTHKGELYDYAVRHQLEWVEDETNLSDIYLRNRLRRSLMRCLSEPDRTKLESLWQNQRQLAHDIDDETNRLLSSVTNSQRHFFGQIDDASALELLRAHLAAKGYSLTRPQRSRLLHAIKTARPGSSIELSGGVIAAFHKRDFSVKNQA